VNLQSVQVGDSAARTRSARHLWIGLTVALLRAKEEISMKLKISIVVLLSALATLVSAPRVVAQTPVQMQTLLDQMKANVARIPVSAEKGRWHANIGMWQVMIGDTQNVPADRLRLLKSHLHEMQVNVARIPESAEKDRWQANAEMWQIMIGHMEGDTHTPFLPALKDHLGRMQTNVAGIIESSEKDRWQANVDVWTIMIGHLETSAE
jgi:hypothetical protein